MKFLLFNLVVIGALTFLFVRQDDAVDLLPDRVAKAVTETLPPTKVAARPTSQANAAPQEPVARDSIAPPPQKVPETAAPIVTPQARSPLIPAIREPVITPPPGAPLLIVPQVNAAPAAAPSGQPPLPAAAPSIPVQSATLAEPSTSPSTAPQPSAEAAARRALVVDAPLTDTGAATPALSPLEKQARLRTLSEEMEFFAVDVLAR